MGAMDDTMSEPTGALGCHHHYGVRLTLVRQ